MSKRLMFLAGAIAVLLAGPALAQGFPSKDVRLINGFSAGGTSDLMARLLAEQLSKQIGKQVMVDNKTGASGMIAAAEAAKAPPDGHTLLLASMAMMSVVPQMVKIAIDVDKDLTTIATVASVYNVLVVGKDTPYKTWRDIAAAAKAAPEKITCATVGSGSSQQLSCALFMALTGTKLTQIPYRGGAPAIIDLTAGRVDAMWGNLPEFMGHIRGGTLRALAYGANAQSPQLPDVPVMSKDGLKEFVIDNWFAIVGPGGMSPDLVKRWNDEINKALASPELKQKFADNGLQIIGGSQADLDKQIASDRAKWGKVIRDFNIKPEH